MPQVLKRNACDRLRSRLPVLPVVHVRKARPALRDVIPFGDDPYDAAGSFGVIVGMLIALLSLVRAFRPYREAPSTAQRTYLVRSQEAVVLVVFLTLASDVVAMGRHPSMWFGASSRTS